jgi:hypothetical protein
LVRANEEEEKAQELEQGAGEVEIRSYLSRPLSFTTESMMMGPARTDSCSSPLLLFLLFLIAIF